MFGKSINGIIIQTVRGLICFFFSSPCRASLAFTDNALALVYLEMLCCWFLLSFICRDDVERNAPKNVSENSGCFLLLQGLVLIQWSLTFALEQVAVTNPCLVHDDWTGLPLLIPV